MDPLNLIANFAAGIFICLAIPLLSSSLQGQPLRRPFSNRPLLNFIGGFFSLFLGLYLLAEIRFPFNVNISSITFWIAFLLTGLWLSSRSDKANTC